MSRHGGVPVTVLGAKDFEKGFLDGSYLIHLLPQEKFPSSLQTSFKGPV